MGEYFRGFLGSAWGRVLLLENSGTPKMETSIGSVGEASATLPALASFFVVLAEEDES